MSSRIPAVPTDGSRGPVVDVRPATLSLRTVCGAEDLLVEEIRPLVPGCRPGRPGVVDLDPGPISDWPDLFAPLVERGFYSGGAMRIARPAGHPAIDTALAVLYPWLPARPRPDPDADPPAQLLELGGLHWPLRHHRLIRLPWSTAPVLGEILARLAKVAPGQRVLDPCCGSGTVLITAGYAGAGELVGIDHHPRALAAARANLCRAGLPAELQPGDAAELPVDPGTVDRVISNLPFGKQVGNHVGNRRLYPRLLAEAARVLTPTGRAVLLTDDKRLFLGAVQSTPGLKIIRSRLLRYSGVSPTAFVLARTKAGRSSGGRTVSRSGR